MPMVNCNCGLHEKMRNNRIKDLMIQKEALRFKGVLHRILQVQTGDAEQDLKAIHKMVDEVLSEKR